MRKTNLESTSRLKNQESCFSYRGLLNNKATLFFALLLLPAMIFAQSNKQQQEQQQLEQKQKELLENQEWVNAKYGNNSQNVQVNENEILQQSQDDVAGYSYQNLLQKLNINEEKLLNSGISRDQIAEMMQQELLAMENYTPDMYRQGSDACSNAEGIDCNSGIVSGSTVGFTADGFEYCAGTFTTGQGVWYVMEGDGYSNTVSVIGNSGFVPRVYVYSGSCGSIQCAGGTTGQGTASAGFLAAFEDTFYLYVTGDGTTTGNYEIELTTDNPSGCEAYSGDGLSSESAFEAFCGDVYSGDTTGFGNTEVGRVDCNGNFSTGQVGVWYKFNDASGTGVILDLCGSDFDTEVSVYEGAALDCVDYNDDGSNCSGNQSFLAFDAQPNIDYYIYIAGYSSGGSEVGPYEMAVLCDGIAPPPPPSVPNNDECPDALEIVCTGVDQVIFGSTILASNTDEPPECDDSFSGVGVWYFIEGDDSIYTLTTCGYDTVLSVYSGDCGNFTCVGSDDIGNTAPNCSSAAIVSFTANESETYYVYVASWNATTESDFELRVSCIAPPEPPANDLCVDAESIACGDTVSGNIYLATNEGNISDCGTSSANNSPGAWYAFEGDGQVVTANLQNTNYDAVLLVYSGDCSNLVCVDGSNVAEVQFSSVIGTDYLIYVTGNDGAVGTYDLEISCQPDPCTVAVPITCGDALTGSTLPGFGSEVGASDDCSGSSPGTYSSFFVFEGTDQLVSMTTCVGTDFDTQLHVYQGSCAELQCVTGNDDDEDCSESNRRSTVNFFAAVGQTYYIQVSGYSGNRGDFTLTVTCLEPLENDTCEDAIAVGCDTSIEGTTILSTDRGNPIEDCSEVSQDFEEGVWYTVNGTGADIELSICDADFDSKLLVYTGSCGEFTCFAGNDDGCGEQSQLIMSTTVGVVYYIYVTGNVGTFSGTEKGTFTLVVECLCTPAEQDDACITLYDGYDPASTATLTGEVLFANGDVTYSWSPNGETTQSIIVDAADGTQNYVVTITDEDGCSVSQSYFVLSVDVDCDRGNSNKVEICHNGTTICVNEHAVSSHLNHGDSLGTCGTDLCDEVIPQCNMAISSPINGANNVNVTPTFSWSAPTGIVTGYTVSISQNGSEIISEDAGDTLIYDLLAELEFDTIYELNVTPYNDNGTAACNNTISFTTISDPAAFDLCENAGEISCGQTISYQSTATATGGTSTSCLGTMGDDLWYKISGDDSFITITVTASVEEPQIGIYESTDGTCSGFSLGSCIASGGSGGNPVSVTFISSVGTEYFIRVGNWINNDPGVDFSISASCEFVEPPINDECDNAIALTVNADYDCGVVTNGTTLLASASSEPDDITGTPNTDVWFTFVAVAENHRISLQNISDYDVSPSTSTDMGMAVYNAENGCDSLTLVGDSDPETYNVSGLNIGDTYVVRVYGWSSDIQYVNFDICVGTEPPPEQVVCGTGFSVTDICYSDSTNLIWTFMSSDGSALEVEFTAGEVENTWDEIIILDSDNTEIYNGYGDSGDLTGLIVGSTGDTITVILTPDSSGDCSSNSYEHIDFDVNCYTPPAPLVCDNTINVSGFSYTNGMEESFVYTSTDGSQVHIDFNSGRTENNWDELIILDTNGSEIYNGYGSNGNLSGLSFVSTGDEITVRVTPDGGVNSSTSNPWDYDVSWTCTGGARMSNPELAWTMYPNPSRGQVNLDLKDFVNNDINVQVLDLSGNVVLNRTVKNLQDPKLQIELNNVPYGMYFVRVQSNDNVSTKKLIITN